MTIICILNVHNPSTYFTFRYIKIEFERFEVVHSCKLNNPEGKFEIGSFRKKLLSSPATARDFVCVSGFGLICLFVFFSPTHPFLCCFPVKTTRTCHHDLKCVQPEWINWSIHDSKCVLDLTSAPMYVLYRPQCVNVCRLPNLWPPFRRKNKSVATPSGSDVRLPEKQNAGKFQGRFREKKKKTTTLKTNFSRIANFAWLQLVC